jgi:hypothetical protein
MKPQQAALVSHFTLQAVSVSHSPHSTAFARSVSSISCGLVEVPTKPATAAATQESSIKQRSYTPAGCVLPHTLVSSSLRDAAAMSELGGSL